MLKHLRQSNLKGTGASYAEQKAARVIRDGGLVAYPTEAVWGLGCNATDDQAVQKLRQLKRRQQHKGFIVLFADISQVQSYLPHLDNKALINIQDQKEPTTWLVPNTHDYKRGHKPCFSKAVVGFNSTVAIRLSSHPSVVALSTLSACPIISSSANQTGFLPLRHLLAIKKAFRQNVNYYLDGKLGGYQKASQIIDLATGRVLRP